MTNQRLPGRSPAGGRQRFPKHCPALYISPPTYYYICIRLADGHELKQNRCRNQPTSVFTYIFRNTHSCHTVIIGQSQTISQPHLQMAQHFNTGREIQSGTEVFSFKLRNHTPRYIPQALSSDFKSDIRTCCRIKLLRLLLFYSPTGTK